MNLMPTVKMDDSISKENPESNVESNVEIEISDKIPEEIPEVEEVPEVQEAPVKDTIPHEDIFTGGPSVQPVKKKRVATEKQKAHLEKIRLKAAASYKLKREQKELEQDKVREEKEAKAKEKEKHVTFQEPTGYSQKQLDHAINQALELNENRRLKRKEAKQSLKKQQIETKKTISVISNAVQKNNPQEYDIWADCFQ